MRADGARRSAPRAHDSLVSERRRRSSTAAGGKRSRSVQTSHRPHGQTSQTHPTLCRPCPRLRCLRLRFVDRHKYGCFVEGFVDATASSLTAFVKLRWSVSQRHVVLRRKSGNMGSISAKFGRQSVVQLFRNNRQWMSFSSAQTPTETHRLTDQICRLGVRIAGSRGRQLRETSIARRRRRLQ